MAKKLDKDNLVPMPWRDFVVGFQLATHALDDSNLEDLPPANPTDPQSRRLRAQQEAIRRDPFMRVLIAVQEHFGQRYRYLSSFVHRFWALVQLTERGHLARWLLTAEGGTSQRGYHPAVLLAAAEVRLTKKAKFPVDRFLARVAEIVAEEGPSE